MPHPARRLALPSLATLATLAACDGMDAVRPGHHFTLTPTPASIAIPAGSSIAVGVTPGGAAPERVRVTWASDAPDVATVAPVDLTGHGAAVSGLRVGTTILRATAREGDAAVMVAIPVTVTPNAGPCLLVGPGIRPATVELSPGDTARLRPVPGGCAEPGDTLFAWSSVDTLVAVVDATGLVTARRAGITAIRGSLRRAPNLVAASTVTVRSAP